MKIAGMLMIITACLLAGGCVYTLCPIYTAKDIVYDPNLLGTWMDKESEEMMMFSAGKDQSYQLTYVEKSGESGHFLVHLVRLGEQFYVDAAPLSQGESADLGNSLLLQAHQFFKITLEKDRFRFAAMNYKWLEKAVETKKISVPHLLQKNKSQEKIILTAETAELQSFLRKHSVDPDAFTDPAEMFRVRPSGTK